MRFTLDYIIEFSASLGYFLVVSRDSRRPDFGTLQCLFDGLISHPHAGTSEGENLTWF